MGEGHIGVLINEVLHTRPVAGVVADRLAIRTDRDELFDQVDLLQGLGQPGGYQPQLQLGHDLAGDPSRARIWAVFSSLGSWSITQRVPRGKASGDNNGTPA